MNSFVELLQNELIERKKRNPNYSLRAFAGWLEVSPAQLSQIISGKRPLTLKMANEFGQRLGLSPVERMHHMAAQWPDWMENAERESLKLSEDRFRLISDWYHFAILSLARLPNAKADARWVARRLGLSVQQANEAMVRLERAGLLRLRPKLQALPEALEVLGEVPSQAIRQYHKQVLNLAAEKLESVPVEERDFQAITLAINPGKMKLAKRLIDDAIRKIESSVETGTPTEVYNLSIQFFPLTHKEKDP